MSGAYEPAMDTPSKAMIKVVVTATREITVPVEDGAILSPNAIRALIQEKLPNCSLTLSSLRVTPTPKSLVGSEVGQELATDDMKGSLVFRMVTENRPATSKRTPVLAVHTDNSLIQVDTVGPVPYSCQPSGQSPSGVQSAPIQSPEVPRHRKNAFKNRVPAFEQHTAGNRVQKHQTKAERLQQRIEHAVKAHQRKQDKPERRMITRFHDSKFDQKAKRHGVAKALEQYAHKRDRKVNNRLQRAAERRWGGEDNGLTDDNKVDMITDQLAEAFGMSKNA